MKTILKILVFLMICSSFGEPKNSQVGCQQIVFLNPESSIPDWAVPVQYIESQPSGGQYIDLGVYPTGDSHIEFKLAYKGINNVVPFGSDKGSTGVEGFSISTWNYALIFGNGKGYNSSIISSLTIEADFVIDKGLYMNGVKLFDSDVSFVSKYLLCIFALNRAGNIAYKTPSCKFYYFKMDDVMDCVPVRFINEIGESEGGMYDIVSGQLFRNNGTGSFIIGPDKR